MNWTDNNCEFTPGEILNFDSRARYFFMAWGVSPAISVKLVQRSFDPEVVELAKRWVYGRIEPDEYFPSLMKLANAYIYHFSLRDLPGMLMIRLRTRLQPETFIWVETNTLKVWTVMERLGEIQVPTQLVAGRYDFLLPPEHQEKLAAGIPNARLAIIANAAHSPEDEQPVDTLRAIREFLAGANSTRFS
jgi:pimeloyl-ACP methyl ester carboxylesterase